MFRIARLLHYAKPLITFFPAFPRPCNLVSTNFMSFSNAQRHKVFERIQANDMQNDLDKIMLDIATLSDKVRQEAISTILTRIFRGQLPPRVIQHQKFKIQLKKHVNLHFNAYFFRIVASMKHLDIHIQGKDNKTKKIIAKQISDSFLTCFDLIKKMQPKDAATNEITLLRTFANYNLVYLSKLVLPAKRQECFNKSKECMKLSLTKISHYLKSLNEEQKKIQNQANPNETLQQKEKRDSKIQEIEKQKFSLAQEYSQLLLELLSLQDNFQEKSNEKEDEPKNKQQISKENKPQNKPQKQFTFLYNQEALALQPIFEKAIKNYSFVSTELIRSKYFYKLKKMLIELKKQKKLRDIPTLGSLQEKQKQFKEIGEEVKARMNQLYAQGFNELKKLQAQNLSSDQLADHIMVLISTQIHRLHIVAQVQSNEIDEKGLGEQVQKIVNCIVNDAKRKKALALIIPQVKEYFGAKIDSYVEKVSRKLRTQRRKRHQQQEEY